MTLDDAATAIVRWFNWQQISYVPYVFANEIGVDHFQITVILQQTPVVKRRVFTLEPLDLPECWQVKEME